MRKYRSTSFNKARFSFVLTPVLGGIEIVIAFMKIDESKV